MNQEEFIEEVARRTGTAPHEAAAITQATMQTLAERISGGQARDLALELPPQLRDHLRKRGEPAEPFGAPEFARRVSERAGVDAGQALRAFRAVLDTLREAVSIGEYEDAVAQLSAEFRQMLEPVHRPSAGA